MPTRHLGCSTRASKRQTPSVRAHERVPRFRVKLHVKGAGIA
jgi:hypothetical protein